jgi:Leucine-rich repeat (LRR) protein
MPAARPAKPRVGPFSAAELARMAWSPSHRAPRVAEMHDPDLFADRPPPSADLTGRAFLAGHHDGSASARLVAVQPFVGELARCPHLRHLSRLDLSGNRIGPAGVRELAASPHLGGLEELNLSGNGLGPDGMAALRAAPWSRHLKGLEVADNGLGADDLAGLPSELAALDVSENPLGSVGADAIRRAIGGPLDTLRAAGCGLGPAAAGLLDLAGVVDLRRNQLGPAAALGARPLPGLHALDLGFNDLGNVAVAGLARAYTAALRTLGLAGNRLTVVPGFTAVEALDLSANPLGDAGAAAVLDGRFPVLARLGLSNAGLTDAGAVALPRSGAAGGLRSLSLAWNRVGDAGVKTLAASPALAGLEELDLTGTPIGFAGAVALAEARHLRLRRLLLGENHRLPADGVRLLRQRFGTISASGGREPPVR